MNVAVWNYRGARDPLIIFQLKEVLNLYSPSIVFLSKTKNQEKFMKQVQERIKFDNSFCGALKGESRWPSPILEDEVNLHEVNVTD